MYIYIHYYLFVMSLTCVFVMYAIHVRACHNWFRCDRVMGYLTLHGVLGVLGHTAHVENTTRAPSIYTSAFGRRDVSFGSG